MIFVLSAMVGYLYWQQTRMLQHIQSLAIVISTQIVPRHEEQQPADEESVSEDDDRVSVKEEEEEDVEKVDGPPEQKETEPVDIDDLQEKTASQLRDMLTKKGIPFGKRDAKTVLIQLLKATA